MATICLLCMPAAHAQQYASPIATTSEQSAGTLDTSPIVSKPETLPKNWEALKAFLDALGENQPLKERLLHQWLTIHPGDEEALFYLARVMAWQNQYNASLQVYDQLLKQSPQNADYLLGKAQVLLWQNKPAEALPLLDQAIVISPNYEDVYRAKLQALRLLRKQAELTQWQAEAKKRFPDKDWSLATQPEGPPIELEAGGGYEHLTNGYRDWSHQYLSFRAPLNQHTGLYGGIIHTDRFSQHDIGLVGGTYFPIPHSKWGTTIEGSISPSNRVLPKWSINAGLQRELPGGLVASVTYRHTEYRDAITEMGIYRLENYWHRTRTSYTLFQSYLHESGQAFSHMAELDYTYGEHSHIGLNGVLGREIENIAHIGVLETDVKAASLFGLQMIRPNWGITYRLLIQQQGNLYTRRGFQFGLRYFL
jgi:YaiO family outer membrane protein